MTKPFDVTKPVQTRDGRPARIVCTDRKHRDGPILALIPYPKGHPHEGQETIKTYYPSGRWVEQFERSDDLVNVPERRSEFRVVYSDNSLGYLLSRIPDYALGTAFVKQAQGCLEFIIEDDKTVDVKFHGR